MMLAAMVTLLGVVPHGNRVELRLDRGSGEMGWGSGSAFRFRRTMGVGSLADAAEAGDAVALEVEETPAVVRVRSKFVEVSIQKSGVLVRVRKADGAPLMTDLTEAEESGGRVSWSREM